MIDSIPRSFSARDVQDLAALARRVGGELALRSLEEDSEQDEDATPIDARSAALEVDASHRVVLASKGLWELFGLPEIEVVGATRQELLERLAHQFQAPQEFLSKTRVARHGPFMAFAEFRLVVPRACQLRWFAKPYAAVGGAYRVREWFMPLG